MFNEATNKFIHVDNDTILKMENSLKAISEWEKKYKKPYIPDKGNNPYEKPEEHTYEEIMYFIKCMVMNIPLEEIDDKIFMGLSEENINEIMQYLQDDQTALKSVPTVSSHGKRDAVKLTSERIYAWMFELQIPLELEYWNINRLMNVIQVMNWDNTPPDEKKKARRKPHEIAKDMAAINAERLKKYGTKG